MEQNSARVCDLGHTLETMRLSEARPQQHKCRSSRQKWSTLSDASRVLDKYRNGVVLWPQMYIRPSDCYNGRPRHTLAPLWGFPIFMSVVKVKKSEIWLAFNSLVIGFCSTLMLLWLTIRPTKTSGTWNASLLGTPVRLRVVQSSHPDADTCQRFRDQM